jgi:Protein of unknown function (DUF1488)
VKQFTDKNKWPVSGNYNRRLAPSPPGRGRGVPVRERIWSKYHGTFSSSIEHDLSGKPPHIFPDRALVHAIQSSAARESRFSQFETASRQTPARRAFFKVSTIGMNEMPLMRGDALRFDLDRMAFEFTMLDNDGDTVRCQISGAAMDELAGTRGTASSERAAQFMSLRNEIERIASERFDRGGILKGAVVRIFAKHIPAAPHPSDSANADRDRRAPDVSASES